MTWQERVQALRGSGLSLRAIGKRVGLTKSSIGDLATGRTREPCGEAAVKLHALHARRCAPRRSSEAAD